jgi:hypothetical protein
MRQSYFSEDQLVKTSEQSKIIIAEDKIFNLTIIKQQMSDLGLTERCVFCIDGQ